jgi:ribosomal protein S18 acetylase RimI-like enzyme
MKIKEVILESESIQAIHLSNLPRFFKTDDPLAKLVPERSTHLFTLHPDKWQSTFFSLTGKNPKKLKYYRPSNIDITPDTLVGDMAIANKFYREKDPKEQSKLAQLYKNSLKPVKSVDISTYKMPELLIPKSVTEDGRIDPPSSGKDTVVKNGITLKSWIDGSNVEIRAYAGNEDDGYIGYAVFDRDGRSLHPDDLAVEKAYQRMGIAQSMYDYVKSLGFVIRRSHDQTSVGKSFWDKNRGEEGTVWEDDFLNEKWSEKYKKSINCNNPKGFSQRAHCQGRKKNEGVQS